MTTASKTIATVKTRIDVPVEKAWKYWTEPQHITQWNAASDDWHTPRAENDLRVGGGFIARMEAKDGSFGFDFGGTYTKIEPLRLIEYTIDDNREVSVEFIQVGNATQIIEEFEAENQNPVEMQQAGWQAIMDNFRKYAEGLKTIVPLRFEILIEASAATVYQKMLDKKHFEEWTAVFNPTSSYEGSWEKGAKIMFLGVDEQGNQGGMMGRIEENIPNEFVSINYYGIIQDDQEITSGPEIEGWAGTHENYTFKTVGGKTLLTVDMDTNREFVDFFNETYPKALDKLKTICEQ